MTNYKLHSWWCCTHTVHSQHNCIFNNSWAGLFMTVWPQQIFPFCCRNWRSFCSAWRIIPQRLVILTMSLYCGMFPVELKCQLHWHWAYWDAEEDHNLSVTFAAFLTDRSILIYMRSFGCWRWLSLHKDLYLYGAGFCRVCMSFQRLPALNSYIYIHPISTSW